MTLSTTTVKNSYSGNGSTSAFNYTFGINSTTELKVIIRSSTGTETTKTITTHYTIADAGAAGGTVTFTSGNIPSSDDTVVLIRDTDLTQETDYVANDPFPAETHESALDKLQMQVQEVQEELDRSIKLSRTNTMTSTEFTVGSTDRQNKILAFDGSGEISVTQELGTFVGNWSAGTTYNARDIVKDTSTNNIFICTTTHTSSGSQPLTSNTDSAKWSLLVDAASATTSATNAASSATAAANSATAAANSATAAATSESNASTSASTASTQATNASNSATAAASSATSAATSFDNFDDIFLGSKSSDPSADNDGDALATGALYFNSTDDVFKVYSGSAWQSTTPSTSNQSNINSAVSNATNINAVAGNATNINAVAGNATNINTVAGNNTNINTVAGANSNITTVAGANSNISAVASNATNINAVAGNATNINTVAGDTTEINAVASNETNINAVNSNSTNINAVAGNATNINTVAGANSNITTVASNVAGVNSFAERYRVAGSDPSSSLDAGDLVFNTTASALKYYDGSSWNAIVAGSLTDIVQDSSPQLGGNLDTNSNNILIDDAHFIADENGNEQIIFQTTSSAVNQIDVTNAATGNPPEISATGDDTNIGLKITPKGSGAVVIDGLSYPTADGSNGQFLTTNGSGTLSFGSVPAGVGGSNGVDFNDNVKARFGKGNDLEIFHDGSDSYIKDAGTGNLRLEGNDLRVANSGGTADYIRCTNGGAVDLLHNNSVMVSTSADGLKFPDNKKAVFGDGNDMTIYHSSTSSYITNSTGDLTFDVDNDIVFDAAGNDFRYECAGTHFLTITRDNSTSNAFITHPTQDKDIIFAGNDGGNGINAVQIDMSAAGAIICKGDVTAFGSPSDIRLKENIEVIPDALEKVCQLQGITFNYKKDGKKSTGLIAQELEKVLPEVVYDTHEIGNDDEKFKSVRYGNVVGLLVESIKELKAEIEELKSKV